MTSGGDWWSQLWSWEATAVYIAWYSWTVACWCALPGKEVEGPPLRNGETLKYRMNGQSRFKPRSRRFVG